MVPKLKRGAVLAGDDWCFEEAGGVYGVRQAVQEFCSLIGVIPEVLPGEPNVEWEQWRILKG